MPCNSGYLNPSERERELQRAAKLLIYVYDILGVTVNNQLQKTADDIYATRDYVPSLCHEIRSMNKENFNRIVYDARNPLSRDLADWWERHEAEDTKRERAEKMEAEKLMKKQEILRKLNMNEEELRILLGN